MLGLTGYYIVNTIANKPSIDFFIGVYLIGGFYMIYQACIWSCMTVSTPKSALSIGYGISSSAQ